MWASMLFSSAFVLTLKFKPVLTSIFCDCHADKSISEGKMPRMIRADKRALYRDSKLNVSEEQKRIPYVKIIHFALVSILRRTPRLTGLHILTLLIVYNP